LRRLAALLTSLTLVLLTGIPADGQEQINPLDPVLDFFQDEANEAYVAQFLKPPVEGISHVIDPPMDFGHSTGSAPGYTPDHIDITQTWAVGFDPGEINLFGPTSENGFWPPMGMNEVMPPNFPPFHTFTGDEEHDGTQFDDGATLFGFFLADTPPVEVKGRCEYVVWINDASRGPTWINRPSFPDDPAGGTNVAFGLGINPNGFTSTFALELQKGSGFIPNFETDIRSFITPNYVGLFVPDSQIGSLEGVNFYTFCVEDGFSFAAEDTGSDQTGLIEMTTEDLGQMVVETEVVVTEAPTTTPPPPPTTQAETTTQETSTADTVASEQPVLISEDSAGFPWWLVALGGFSLAMLGFWLFLNGDPCKKLLETWQAAQKACDEAQEKADDAADECEEADLDLEDLEEERKEACKAWPPACWSTDEGAWVQDEHGNRITSRDLHMKRMALGEVWADYKADKLSAREVEAKWKEMDTPEFREEMRETDEAFNDLLEDIDADLGEAKNAADRACEKAVNAQRAADEACAKAEAARKAYEECVNKEVAAADAAAEAGTGGEGAPTGPTGPGTAPPPTSPGSQAPDPCKDVEPKRKYVAAGNADRIRVYVDFSIITGRYEGSQRNVAAGEQLVTNLADLARDLDFAGDMLNARSAGLHLGGASNGFRQGKYVATGAGVVKGGIDATMATTDLIPDVPTTPVQAGTEFLEKTAELGKVVAAKVTEWMGNYEMYTVRKSMFHQTITATPYNIMECREGQGWVCLEKVWEFEVGQLRVQKGTDRWFTMNSTVRRAQYQRAVRGLSQYAANQVKKSANDLIAWRAKHEPGACD
jgi:hypothetical protein